MNTSQSDLKGSLKKLEDMLQLYMVDKAPFQIPQNIRELIVTFAPWLIIISIIITLPAILAVFGLGALVAPFTAFMGPGYALSYGVSYMVSMVVMIVVLVLEALAVPGLFSKSMKGWRLMYYATLLSIVSSLIQFNIITAILSGLIGFYILFQIKSSYK